MTDKKLMRIEYDARDDSPPCLVLQCTCGTTTHRCRAYADKDHPGVVCANCGEFALAPSLVVLQ